MALKALLETLDGVDDAVKPFYAEADGKFVLQVEGVDDHPDVANLKNAYSRTKADKESAKQEAATLKAQIEELRKGAPDTAATQAKITQLQEQLDAANAKAGEWQTKYTGVTRDQALTGALQSAGITSPTFLKAAQAMLSGMVKLGEDGSAYVETGMGPKVLGDFVKGWAASEGKDFVTPPKGGGAGGTDQTRTGTTMKRSDFEKLDPAAQQKAIVTDKVTLVD
jgi:hypothetical protein